MKGKQTTLNHRLKYGQKKLLSGVTEGWKIYHGMDLPMLECVHKKARPQLTMYKKNRTVIHLTCWVSFFSLLQWFLVSRFVTKWSFTREEIPPREPSILFWVQVQFRRNECELLHVIVWAKCGTSTKCVCEGYGNVWTAMNWFMLWIGGTAMKLRNY